MIDRFWTLTGLASIILFQTSDAASATCNQDQQRQSDFPSGSQIANALTKNDALDNVCSDSWPPGNDKIKTYNEGEVIYNVTRQDPNDSLDQCSSGFQAIIDQCISGDNYWGGNYIYSQLTYAIYNSAYPSNGLPPWDATSSRNPDPTNTGSARTTSDSNAATTTAGANGEATSTLVTPSSTTGGAPQTTSRSGENDGGTTTGGGGGGGGSVSNPTATQSGGPPASIPGETIVTETNSGGSVIVATVSAFPMFKG